MPGTNPYSLVKTIDEKREQFKRNWDNAVKASDAETQFDMTKDDWDALDKAKAEVCRHPVLHINVKGSYYCIDCNDGFFTTTQFYPDPLTDPVYRPPVGPELQRVVDSLNGEED